MVLHLLPFVNFFFFFFRGVVVMTFLTKYRLIHEISKTFLFLSVFPLLSLSYIWERHIWNAFFWCSAGSKCCRWNFNVTIMGTKVVWNTSSIHKDTFVAICIIEKKNSFNLFASEIGIIVIYELYIIVLSLLL